MRLLADVHISPITVAALRGTGYQIERSTEYISANAPDREVFATLTIEIVLCFHYFLKKLSGRVEGHNISNRINPKWTKSSHAYEEWKQRVVRLQSKKKEA